MTMMMKLSRLLRSRSALSEKLLNGKVRNATNAMWTRDLTSDAGMLSGNRPHNFFTDYTVFKGKAALSACPILPTLNKPENSSKFDKGRILLTFWPASGERKYDWQKRQVFALSPTELGSLISLDSGKSCEFFHDPSMKSSNAGQVRKTLSVTPLSDDSGGYFFTLTVVNNNMKTNERFSVPVNRAEYTVMRTAFSYILPHIIGWNPVSSQVPARSDFSPGRPFSSHMPAGNGLNPVRRQEVQPSQYSEWDR